MRLALSGKRKRGGGRKGKKAGRQGQLWVDDQRGSLRSCHPKDEDQMTSLKSIPGGSHKLEQGLRGAAYLGV